MMRISERERQYVNEVLDGQFRGATSNVMMQRLEKLFAEKFGVRYAISHINGTATLHAALVAAGVGPGDEVIVPPLTMASTSFAVLHAGAVPVFADIDPHTWTLDPECVERLITPRTKAIEPVAIYGLSPDIDRLMEIAARHNLKVIEDDAECFLGYNRGRVVGSVAHLASFSFQSSKHMTSGEGGMVTTNDEELATAVRRFNSLGYAAVGASKGKITRDTIQDPNYCRHASMGFNYRMPELCCAVALGQLERLEELVSERQHCARVFGQVIAHCTWLRPQHVPDGYVHSYWTYPVLLAPEVDFSWYDFRAKFREFGGDGIYAAWRLTYLEPAFEGREFDAAHTAPHEKQICGRGLCPVAESVQPRIFQFKTNYTDRARLERQAEVLAQTIAYFEGRQVHAICSSLALEAR